MTLGKRIARYRKDLGISQEALGERLGVSRQAVSKWETDAAVPDMENLLALSREFGVPLSHLTGTPAEEPHEAPSSAFPLKYFLVPILCALAGAAMAGTLLLLTSRTPENIPAAPAPVQSQEEAAITMPASEFALLWSSSEEFTEFLELGVQEQHFPFGTTLELTEPETVLDTDFASMEHHIADCGAITVEYSRIEEEPILETVTKLSTISKSISTPRNIFPGSSEHTLLEAYGDTLIYCLKEEDNYVLVPHDHFYAYCEGPLALLFYIRQGEVAGLLAENLMDGAGMYAADHIHRFPMVNGEPDFSLRQEPEREYLSDTRKVYIAFNQLVTNGNLTAEELYTYRRDIFALLPYIDWQEFSQLGEADEATNIFSLMDYLARQETYIPSQILHLQMGCTAPGIDGAYADMYSQILAQALFYDPAGFAKALSTEGVPIETMYLAMTLAAYSAELDTAKLENTVAALQKTLNDGTLAQAQRGWTELLLSYLTTPMGEWISLPHSPQ